MSDDRSSSSSATVNLRRRVEPDSENPRFPDPTPSRDVVFAEWRTRMRRRWDVGEEVGVEAFFAEFPHLVEDPQAVFNLLLEEVDLRAQRGDVPTLDEVRERFPSLVRHLELHLRHRAALQRVHEPTTEEAPTLDLPPASAAEIRRSVREASLPEVVAGYQILSELGRGGMGVVYLARHLELGRFVAIKMILSTRFACDEDRVRFRIEGETAASLHHANIVQIYEVGSFENQPFMVLEYIEGGTLSQKLRELAPSFEAAAHHVESLARAVHHAHALGVVHRDLKPANILLEPTNDPAHPLGSPKIADFGLAKHLDRVGPHTETGRVLGTPQYMAPEQAAGQTRKIGPATDVYSLGAILYELLAGRPPFESTAALDLMAQVMSADPVPVRRFARRVPRDLETIVAKCLEKEPANRYGSAADLADDICRFRIGEPIHARPVGFVERAWKWARRRPLIAGLLTSLILVTLLGFAGVTVAFVYAYRGWNEAERQHGIAIQESAAADLEREVAEEAVEAEADARRRAETNLTFNRLTRAHFLWRLSNLELSSRELRTIPVADRGWDWRYLQNLHESATHTYTHPTMPEVSSLVYSPDGKQLAVAMGNPYTPYRNHVRPSTVVLYDAATRRRLLSLNGLRDIPRSIAYSPDGKHLAAGSNDGYLHVWNASTGESIHVIRDPGRERVAEVAWSPDGKRLAVASFGAVLSILDFASGDLLQKLHTQDTQVRRVTWSPDGQWIASSASHVRLWNARTGKMIREFDHPCTNGLVFSPDSRILAGAEGNRVHLYNTTTWQPLFGFTGHEGLLAGLTFSPDGQTLATAGSDTMVRLWSVHDGREVVSWRGHHGRVTSVAFHPEGHTLASGGAQPGEVKVWGLSLTPEYTHLAEPGYLPVVHGLAFTLDGRETVFVRSGGQTERREVVTGDLRQMHQLPINSSWLVPGTLAAVSGDTSRIVGIDAADGRTVRLFDSRTGNTLGPSHSHDEAVWHVAIDQAGTRFASASNSGASLPPDKFRTAEFVVGDGISGTELLRKAWKGRSRALALSRDGRWVACCREVHAEASDVETGRPRLLKSSTRVELWELPVGNSTARHHLSLTTPSHFLAGVAFSGDGRMLAASSAEGRLYLWHLPSGDPVHEEIDSLSGLPRVRGLSAPYGLESLAFSPDGRLIAGVNRELVKLWDAREGLEVLTLRGAPPRHRDGGFSPRVAWSHDGRRLAISNWDRSVTVWDGADVTTPQGREAQANAARARLPRWYLDNATAALDRKAYGAVAFNLARVDPFGPLERDLALRRGEIHAGMGRWADALRDYRCAFDGGTAFRIDTWRRFVQLLAFSGDHAGHDQARARMHQLHGASASTVEPEFVRGLTFREGTAPGLDLIAAARAGLAQYPNHESARLNFALTCLRSGKPREAIEPCKKCLTDAGIESMQTPLLWLVLGLAHQRLSESNEARKWQVLAEARLAEWEKACEASPSKIPARLTWPDWLHMLQLRDELRKALP